MPEKVNGNKFSGKSNTASLNSGNTSIEPKSAVQLNSTEHKLATVQKMANNSPYSQRFTQLKSLANKTTPSHHPVSQLSKDSHSLPDNVKQGVESLSGISMDDVKVHYNSAKPAQLNAHAYAQGTDIHIASGQEKHLPHEAWHVVQQKQGRVQPTTMMKAKVPINDDQGLEKEADVMGARALQMKPFSLSDYSAGKSVQRKGVVQKVGEKKQWEYPEGEKPERNISSLLDVFTKEEEEGYVDNGINDNDLPSAHPDKGYALVAENPYEKEEEEFSPNQILKTVSSEKNALSIKIEEIKVKEEETNAIEEAKKAKILEVETELKNTEEEIKKAEEAVRVAAKAAADLAAADLATAALGVAAKEASDLAAANVTAAVIKALAANEKAEQEWQKYQLVYWFNEKSLNLVDLAGTSGRVQDVRADLGSDVHAENYANSAGQGAAVGSVVDLFELFGSYGKWQESGKTGFDHAKLGLTLGRFTTGFIDMVNTTLKYTKDSAGYLPEVLTHSISLLPGIKAGLGAFRNAIEFAENIKQGNDLDKILSLGRAQGVTGSIFNDLLFNSKYLFLYFKYFL
jgi:hypothetical protein